MASLINLCFFGPYLSVEENDNEEEIFEEPVDDIQEAADILPDVEPTYPTDFQMPDCQEPFVWDPVSEECVGMVDPEDLEDVDAAENCKIFNGFMFLKSSPASLEKGIPFFLMIRTL